MIEQSLITYYTHPKYGEVRILDEVIANDERRWVLVRETTNMNEFWIAKDEVFGLAKE
jgi:hypothetical protein